MIGRWQLGLIFIVLLGSIASACSGGTPQPSEGTPIPVVIKDVGVTAEGRLVPVEYVQLGFNLAGEIVEVLVEEGDIVDSGQVVARLKFRDNRESLEAAIAGAEFELMSAEHAYIQLFEGHEMRAAEAKLELANARDALHDAEYTWRVRQQGNRASGDTINAAEANLVLAEKEVDRAQSDFNKYSGRPDDDSSRAFTLSNLVAAKNHRDSVLRQLNWYKGKPTEIDQGILDAEVEYAKACLDEAERVWQTLKDGPDQDEVVLAQERITNAEAQLTAARAALADLDDQVPELKSPISGTVVDLSLKVGENAVPGQVGMVVADFSRWLVETDDLTELDVVEVSPGEPVIIHPDALPDLQLNGLVDSIANMFEDKRGDVTYTAKIMLDEIDPRLRWGMKVVVEF